MAHLYVEPRVSLGYQSIRYPITRADNPKMVWWDLSLRSLIPWYRDFWSVMAGSATFTRDIGDFCIVTAGGWVEELITVLLIDCCWGERVYDYGRCVDRRMRSDFSCCRIRVRILKFDDGVWNSWYGWWVSVWIVTAGVEIDFWDEEVEMRWESHRYITRNVFFSSDIGSG